MKRELSQHRPAADRIYSFLVEEEDARVCKDIPEEACTDVPGNFFKISLSQTLHSLADELGNAKTVLPWVLSSLGAPAALTGFLVPVRESGSLLPQLVIASAVRSRPKRKYVWMVGAVLQAAALAGMGAVAFTLRGLAGGLAILGLLVLFSLARGLVSVASKDITGKTIPKTRRGRLSGFTTSMAGVLTLGLGALLATLLSDDPEPGILAVILLGGALLWLLSTAVFATVRESPGATGGGANALNEALERLRLLKTDAPFRRFVWVRALLISTGLAAPYYVVMAREESGSGNLLGLFVLGSGLASALSAAVWGRFSDHSSRKVLMAAASVASGLGLLFFFLNLLGLVARFAWLAPVGFFLLSMAHSGVRIGRKTYILDLASGDRRTDYVAVSNTLIGVALLLGGALGILAPLVGPGGMLLILSLMGFAGVLGGRGLPETE